MSNDFEVICDPVETHNAVKWGDATIIGLSLVNRTDVGNMVYTPGKPTGPS